MTKEEKQSLIEELVQEDYEVLIDLYYKRCLTRELLDLYVYQGNYIDPDIDSVEHRIADLTEKKLIEVVLYKGDNKAYFLAPDGVTLAKHLIETLPNAENLGINKPYKKLLMNPFLIGHQLALNEFSYKLCDWAKSKGIAYQYKDQIFAPKLCKNAMTDGLFFLEDRIFFLETDMGNETRKDLQVKWTNYASFLNNPNPEYKDKKITVLFITEEVENPRLRSTFVLATLHALITTKFSQDFELLVGSQEELIGFLEQSWESEAENVRSLLKEKHGFELRPGNGIELDGKIFDHYLYLDGGGKVLSVDGRAQSYFLDFWYDRRASVLSKILYFNRVEYLIKQKNRQDIGYVVVAPDEKCIAQLVKKSKFDIADNVFFTTPKRLAKRPWNEALFTTDVLQKIYQHSDFSLKTKVFEKSKAE